MSISQVARGGGLADFSLECQTSPLERVCMRVCVHNVSHVAPHAVNIAENSINTALCSDVAEEQTNVYTSRNICFAYHHTHSSYLSSDASR